MLNDIGIVLSTLAGFFIGMWLRCLLKELKNEKQKEETELIDRQLKVKIDSIRKREENKLLKYQLEKELQIEKEKARMRRIAEMIAQECNYTSDPVMILNPKAGMVASFDGKLMTYTKDNIWVPLENKPQNTASRILEDLWYGVRRP